MNSHSLRQRRRRVTLDTNQKSSAAAGPDTEPMRSASTRRRLPKRPYTEGARRSNQRKTTDFIPKRPRARFLFGGALVLAVLLLNLLHAWSGELAATLPATSQLLALTSSAGIGSWYGSLLALATAAAALQVLALRRHRRNDYQGTYRVWWGVAILFAVLSFATTAPLAAACGELLSRILGRDGLGLSWLAIGSFGLALAVTSRLFLEIRGCRAAVVGCAIVLFASAAEISIHEWQLEQSWAFRWLPAAATNLHFVWVSAALFATTAFARHIYLHANGILTDDMVQGHASAQRQTDSQSTAPKKKRRKSRSNSEAESEIAEPTANDDGKSTKSASKSARKVAESAEPEASEPTADDTPSKSVPSKSALSKAASKSAQRRLRKQQRRAA